MKLNKDFLIHNSGGEIMLVPTGKAKFSGLVRGNSSFGAVLEILTDNSADNDESGVSAEDIVAAMRKRFDAPAGIIEQDVKMVLAELRKIGAIDD